MPIAMDSRIYGWSYMTMYVNSNVITCACCMFCMQNFAWNFMTIFIKSLDKIWYQIKIDSLFSTSLRESWSLSTWYWANDIDPNRRIGSVSPLNDIWLAVSLKYFHMRSSLYFAPFLKSCFVDVFPRWNAVIDLETSTTVMLFIRR